MVMVYLSESSSTRHPSRTITVILADDHAVVRAGIRHLLKKASDIQVIGEAKNGSEALQMVKELNPEVLILDLEMPHMDGVEVTRRIRESGSSVRVLVLSAYEDLQYVKEVLQLGASGYLTKDEVPEVVVDAVRGISNGIEGWLSPRIASLLYRDADPGSKQIGSGLTVLEREILNSLISNKKLAELAVDLNLKERTLQRMIQSMCLKLGVQEVGELLHIAKEKGIRKFGGPQSG